MSLNCDKENEWRILFTRLFFLFENNKLPALTTNLKSPIDLCTISRLLCLTYLTDSIYRDCLMNIYEWSYIESRKNSLDILHMSLLKPKWFTLKLKTNKICSNLAYLLCQQINQFRMIHIVQCLHINTQRSSNSFNIQSK